MIVNRLMFTFPFSCIYVSCTGLSTIVIPNRPTRADLELQACRDGACTDTGTS